jgi:hypothetical protein
MRPGLLYRRVSSMTLAQPHIRHWPRGRGRSVVDAASASAQVLSRVLHVRFGVRQRDAMRDSCIDAIVGLGLQPLSALTRASPACVAYCAKSS